MQKQQVISTVLSVGTVVTCYQTADAVYLVSSKNQRYVYESKFRFSTCVCVCVCMMQMIQKRKRILSCSSDGDVPAVLEHI